MLCGLPALWVDQIRFICENEERLTLKHAFHEFSARFIGAIVFPIFCSLDAIYQGGVSLKERIITVWTSGAAKKEHQERAAVAGDLFKKCAYGVMGSCMDWIHADLATIHFIPPREETGVVRPYGRYYSQEVETLSPTTPEEVQAIIQRARAEGKKIGIAGARFSQGKQILPSEKGQILLDMKAFNQINIDLGTRVATVGAGAIWKELQDAADKLDFAIQVQQASDVFSVGGSISVNCHGWDHIQGSLGHTLRSLTIVDADGNIQKLKPEDDLFKCVVGGFGQFGVILEAEIQLTDNQHLIEKGESVEIKDFVRYFNEQVLTDPNIKMTLYRLSLEPGKLLQKGVAQHYVEDNGILINPPLIDEPDGGTRFDRVGLQVGRRSAFFRRLWNAFNWKEMQGERHLSRNEAMRPPIKAAINNSRTYCEWLQEFFVKGEDLADFLQVLGKTLDQHGVSLLNCSVRYVKQDDTSHLAYAKDGDRFAVVLFFNQALTPKKIKETEGWVKKMIDYVSERGGTYYLPYQHFATKEQFRKSYPHWETLAEKKKQYDPSNVFESGLGREYLFGEDEMVSRVSSTPSVSLPSVSRVESSASDLDLASIVQAPATPYRHVFGNVELRRQFGQFLDNVFMQLDNNKFFKLIDDILKNPKLNDEQVYAELYRRIDEARPSPLGRIRGIFRSLSVLKKVMGEQAETLFGRGKEIKGMLEIGYPGRHIGDFKSRFKVSGPTTAISFGPEKLSDKVQHGLFKPYKNYHEIGDFEPIEGIADKSFEEAHMFIGLHHNPIEKLGDYADWLHRIIAPGGSLLLRDHDVTNPELLDLVTVVHSVFNAATGETPESDKGEVRNFQSIQAWTDLLENHGFMRVDDKGLVQEGDPTINTLVRYVRKPENDEEALALIKSLARESKGYDKQACEFALSATEWYNVATTEEHAQFMQNAASGLHTETVDQFPYFRHIAILWGVFASSWKAARKEHSWISVITSENFVVSTILATIMTVEYLFKGVIFAPTALFSQRAKKEAETVRTLSEFAANYVDFVHKRYFHEYNYFSAIKPFWATTKEALVDDAQEYGVVSAIFSSKTFLNLYISTVMTIGLIAKGIFCGLMNLMYGNVKGDPRTEMIVKGDARNLDHRVKVIREVNGYQHISFPAYLPAVEILSKLEGRPDLKVVEINGSNKVYLKAKLSKGQEIESGKKVIEHDILAVDNDRNKYSTYEVEVEKLGEMVSEIHRKRGKVSYIHAY